MLSNYRGFGQQSPQQLASCCCSDELTLAYAAFSGPCEGTTTSNKILCPRYSALSCIPKRESHFSLVGSGGGDGRDCGVDRSDNSRRQVGVDDRVRVHTESDGLRVQTTEMMGRRPPRSKLLPPVWSTWTPAEL
ncbi:hypothetical protein Q1695_009344 [Nippostrongylus brasiliensis]|nr:hypothetical protein Q1695_009344 [Nippostrongylus brasiliensis]